MSGVSQGTVLGPYSFSRIRRSACLQMAVNYTDKYKIKLIHKNCKNTLKSYLRFGK